MLSEIRRERVFQNWLYHIPGLGRKRLRTILSHDKGAECFFEEEEKELLLFLEKKCNYTEQMATTLCSALMDARKWDPWKMYNKIEEKGICFLPYTDRNYPVVLKDIPDAPYALYRMGKRRELQGMGEKYTEGMSRMEGAPTVAVVGARRCSAYGTYVANQIGQGCAKRGIKVVSGLAYGIDATVQWAALCAGGNVTAVLGSGVDVCYPPGNEKIYTALKREGEIYSEYVPGTQPKAQFFPPRNRIISGLSDAVIVVEAKQKSGTLITVDMALEQGKDVYVVPGRLTDPLSAGCNRLLQQGALPVHDVDEVLDTMSTTFGNKKSLGEKSERNGTGASGIKMNPYKKSELKHTIYKALDVKPKSVQEIWDSMKEQKKMEIAVLQTQLLHMQMEGGIKEENGRYFIAW